MGTISDKLTYLNTTKSQLKTMISYGYPLTNETFRQYVDGVFKALINSMTTCENPTWNNLPKLTTTPGTTQSINNTTEAPMKIELGANELSQSATPTPTSPQAVHTITGENTIKVLGKNLFDKNDIVSGKWLNVDDGHESSDANFAHSNYILIDSSNSYYLSGMNSGSGTNPGACFYDKDKTFISGIKNDNATSKLYNTIPTNAKYMQISFKLADINTIMLNVGTPTTYEPYKGNSYEINLGKNLLNFGNISGTSNNVNYSIVNGKLLLDGSCNSDRVTLNLPTQIKLNGTYTFSTNYIKATALKNSGGTNLFLTTSSNGIKTETINDTPTQLIIYGLTGVTFSNQEIELQVEKGSTATDYTPYFTPIEYCKIGDYKDEFIRATGKNLLDIKDGSITETDITSNSENGIVTINGTASANRFINLIKGLKLKAGTYTLSAFNTNTLTGDNRIRLTSVNGETIYVSVYFSSTNNKTTFTLNEDYDNLWVQLRIASGTSLSNFVIYPQLEKGNITTPIYEPYGKNEWWLKKAIGKYTFTGSESWTSQSYGTNSWNTSAFLNTISNDNIKLVMSNIFYGIPKADRNQEYSNSCYANNTTNFYIRNTSYTTNAEVQSATAGNYVYYVLATPTYTKINIVDLIYQLEAIRNSKSQNNQTNINQVNTDLAFILNTIVLEDLS